MLCKPSRLAIAPASVAVLKQMTATRNRAGSRICRFIEQHLDDRLTLPRLAHEFHRSPFHLQRTFKSVLGVSPKAYIDAAGFAR